MAIDVPLISRPIAYDIYIYEGATLGVIFEVTDDTGDIVSLTGYTGALQGRNPEHSGTVVFSPTVTIDASLGLVQVAMTAAATTALAPESFPAYYDLELTKAGVVTRFAQGKVFFDPENTHA